MRNIFSFFICLSLAAAAAAVSLPYDESADASSDVRHALQRAHDGNKEVLLVFGANWCLDCRELDKAMHGKSAQEIDEKFIVVKVDVGNFDKNVELAKSYGNPIKKGIPAAVVLTPDNKLVYSTKAGELADARRMGEQGIYDFFSEVARNKE